MISPSTCRADGDLGLFGIVFPEQWGGGGGDFAALSWRSRSSVGSTSPWESPVGRRRPRRQPDLFRSGPTNSATDWLPDLVAGGRWERSGYRTRWRVGTWAPRERAVEEDDSWVLDGSGFITNCGTEITSIVTATVRTDDGIAFVVPAARRHDDRAAERQTRLARQRHARHLLRAVRDPEGSCSASRARGSGVSCRSSTTGGSRPRSPLGRRVCVELSTVPKQRNAFGGPIGRFHSSRSNFRSRRAGRDRTSCTRRRG